jgi:hypothetical protein
VAEFRDKARELARLSTMPEVKRRLERLAANYEKELQAINAPSATSR